MKKKFNSEAKYMKVYVELFYILSPEATLLLSNLIDVEPVIKKWDGEYARISYSFIQERLDWSNHVIRTTLKEIEEAGFIQIRESRIKEHKRNVNAMFIRIDHAKLAEALDDEYEETPQVVNLHEVRYY